MALSNSVTLTPVVSSIPQSDFPVFIPRDIISAALSGNGNVLAFISSQALLVEDGNGVSDIYVKDFANNTLRLISINTDPGQADARPYELSLSADGRFLAYFALGNNGMIHVKDLQTGALTLASASSGNVAANSVCTAPEISADGHFVTFLSKATNLTSLDTFGKNQAYVKNLQTGALTLVSSDANGNPANKDALAPSISADGHFVQFGSGSTNLLPGEQYANRKAFVKDVQTGAIIMTSTDPAGHMTQIVSEGGQISANGRYSLFDSYSDLIPEDVNGRSDVYVKDLQTGVLQMVSPGGMLSKTNSNIKADAISADGRFVLFHATVADLIGNDDQGMSPLGEFHDDAQYYLRDMSTGILSRISSDAMGHKANAPSTLAVLAPDGQSVVFLSAASNLGGPAGKETLYRSTIGAPVQHPHDKLEDSATAPQVLAGGLGDDSYLISHSGSRIIEMADQGIDRVVSVIDHFVLPSNVEELQLRGSVAAHGVGNEMANIIRGSDIDNRLEGMGGDDLFYNSKGSDTIDGGAGHDTVSYTSFRDSVQIGKVNGDHFTLSLIESSTGGYDTLMNIERVNLGDVSIALDIDGAAGQAFRIYQAAFNRTPDMTGLGFWINAMDHGASLNEVARGFVNSAEFTALYGSNPTNADIVTRLYTNVLHRAPDAGGAAFWTDVLDGHRATVPEVPAQFSESPENKAALVGVTQNGIDYIPYV